MTEYKKFMFDLNDFDDPIEDEMEEEETPPPPTFSEEELEQAKKDAFEEGRIQGVKESKESRDEYIGKLINNISLSLDQFKANETKRDNIFEKEVIELSLTIFTKCFPLLQDRYGLDETINVIGNTINKFCTSDKIIINVSPDEKDEIETKLKSNEKLNDSNYFVVSSDITASGTCTINWEDGGAARDPIKLATEIQKKLEESLAENTNNTQNQTVDENGDLNER